MRDGLPDTSEAVNPFEELRSRAKVDNRWSAAIIAVTISVIVSIATIAAAIVEAEGPLGNLGATELEERKDYFRSFGQEPKKQEMSTERKIQLTERKRLATSLKLELEAYKDELRAVIKSDGGNVPEDFDYCEFFLKTERLEGGIDETVSKMARKKVKQTSDSYKNDKEMDVFSFLNSVTQLTKNVSRDDSRSFMTDIFDPDKDNSGGNCEAHSKKAICLGGTRFPASQFKVQGYLSANKESAIPHVRTVVEVEDNTWVRMDPNDAKAIVMTENDWSCSMVMEVDQMVFRFLGNDPVYEVYPCTNNEVKLPVRSSFSDGQAITFPFSLSKKGSQEKKDGTDDITKLDTDIEIEIIEMDREELEKLRKPLSSSEIVRRRLREDNHTLAIDEHVINDPEGLELVKSALLDDLKEFYTIHISVPGFDYGLIPSRFSEAKREIDLRNVRSQKDFDRMIEALEFGYTAPDTMLIETASIYFDDDSVKWLEGVEKEYPNIDSLSLINEGEKKVSGSVFVSLANRFPSLKKLSISNCDEIDLGKLDLPELDSLTVGPADLVFGASKLRQMKHLDLNNTSVINNCNLSKIALSTNFDAKYLPLDCLKTIPVGIHEMSAYKFTNNIDLQKEILLKHRKTLRGVHLTLTHFLADAEIPMILTELTALEKILIIVKESDIDKDVLTGLTRFISKTLKLDYMFHWAGGSEEGQTLYGYYFEKKGVYLNDYIFEDVDE